MVPASLRENIAKDVICFYFDKGMRIICERDSEHKIKWWALCGVFNDMLLVAENWLRAEEYRYAIGPLMGAYTFLYEEPEWDSLGHPDTDALDTRLTEAKQRLLRYNSTDDSHK